MKHLLVLCCRILAISAIVLAFAQPYIPHDDDRVLQQENNVSIFIDNSFSMEAEGISASLLDEAKVKAKEIVNAFQPTDRFQLLTNDFEGSQQRWITKDEFLEQLNYVEISPYSRVLSEIINRQQDAFTSIGDHGKEAYILSDFQKENTDFERISSDSSIRHNLLPMQAQFVANVSVDSLFLSAPVVQAGQEVKLTAIVSNYGNIDLEKIPVKLSLNKQLRYVGNVDLAAFESKTLDMAFSLQESGLLQGVVEINDAPVSFDDKLFFSLFANQEIEILAIHENAENIYLNKLFAKDTYIKLTNISLRNIDYSSLSNYSLIMLNGLYEIPSGLSNELSTYLKKGGELLIFPGTNIDLASYNNFLADFSATRYGEISTTKATVENILLKHSIFQDVFEKRPENIQLPQLHKYYPLLRGSKTVGENLLTLNNEMPFLRKEQNGKAVIYLCATAIDDEFTDFQKQPLFVVSLYNMALQSKEPHQLYAMINNDRIPISGIEKNSEVLKLTASDETFEIIPDVRSNDYNTYILTHGQLKTAGNYLLKKEQQVLDGISLNYNRNESSGICFSPSEIKTHLADHNLENIRLIESGEKSIASIIAEEQRGFQLSKILIIFALFFLLTEVLLLRFWQ